MKIKHSAIKSNLPLPTTVPTVADQFRICLPACLWVTRTKNRTVLCLPILESYQDIGLQIYHLCERFGV
ncbi:unnamed protein product [Larinioides sclopetarius]|uniref:Uncharacterized protein n=1 Tax=Larinioides sclopetarius TaxID=280406 RepID=A0AAV2A5T3_9ARAC